MARNALLGLCTANIAKLYLKDAGSWKKANTYKILILLFTCKMKDEPFKNLQKMITIWVGGLELNQRLIFLQKFQEKGKNI